MRSIFFSWLSLFCLQEGVLAGAFLRGDLNSFGYLRLGWGVFISFIVIYDYVVLLSCSIWFLYLVLENLILLTFAHVG